MKLTVKIDIKGLLAIPKGTLRNIFREGIRQAGIYWWRNYLPLHFTAGATKRYGYTERDATYRRRKRLGAEITGVKSIQEDKPLVWSGRSRERALNNQKIRALAKSADLVRCEVVINAPALNFRYKGSKINMRDEVTRTIPSEEQMLERVYARESQKALAATGNRHRITKRIAA